MLHARLDLADHASVANRFEEVREAPLQAQVVLHRHTRVRDARVKYGDPPRTVTAWLTGLLARNAMVCGSKGGKKRRA